MHPPQPPLSPYLGDNYLEKHVVGDRLLLTFWEDGTFQLQTFSQADSIVIPLKSWTIKDFLNMNVGDPIYSDIRIDDKVPFFLLSPTLNSLLWIWIERNGPLPKGLNKLTKDAVKMYRPAF